MKYLCNEDGVLSLRKSAGTIKSVSAELNEKTFSVNNSVCELAAEGDNPAEQIKEVFEQIRLSMDNLNSAVSTISAKLNDVADGFEEIIKEEMFK